MGPIETDIINAGIVANLRNWLNSGATISATDKGRPVLEILPDGTVFGGLSIVFPPGSASTGLVVTT
jgi:hypothetical protein